MSLLSRFMNLEGISNMKDSKTKTSIEHILEAYETWNLEFQKLIPQLHKTLNPRTSVCKAFNQSIEKAYARFYKWIHTIHPNTEFSNIMSVHECAKFLATQN
ncbi:hypothetical protein HMI55_002281 [Coelomomyces lativittatus]|nr:hypothetical protein HMI55_002281 [Coelomomyces lativittatus]